MRRRRRPRSRWRRHLRLRRCAVATLLALAAISVLREVGAADPRDTGIPMAIAATELPIGTTLGEAEIAVTTVAADSPLARSALAPRDVVGRTTAGPVQAGEALTSSRLVGDPGRPGFTSMPVTLTDPQVVEFLSAGMLVDLVWTPGEFAEGTARVIAHSARIVRIAAPEDHVSARMPVLIEVATGDAIGVAAAMTSGSLSVLVSPPPEGAPD